MSNIEQSHKNFKEEVEKTQFEIYNEQIDIKSLPLLTRSQLQQYDGIQKPGIYVAIRGYVYDVSHNAKNYGPGKSYHKLVGKDCTRLLGLNKLQLSSSNVKENNDPTESTWYSDDFNEIQNAIVDKWILFFKKRYSIVAAVVDHESDSII